MHDLVIVGVPLFAILSGILFGRNDMRDLRSEMKDLRSEIKDIRTEIRNLHNETQGEIKDLRSEVLGHLSRIDADLRQFYHLTGSLEARMDSLEKR